MLSLLTNLYNNGANCGDIVIKTNDKEIKGHKFILCLTSEYFGNLCNDTKFNNIVELNFNYTVVNVILTYLYTEKIIAIPISAEEIIQIYDLVNFLRCHNSIEILKNHFYKKFVQCVCDENWKKLLLQVYGIAKYANLQEIILDFYKNTILCNIHVINLEEFKKNHTDMENGLKDMLFSICIDKLNELTFCKNEGITNNTSNMNKKKINTFLKKIDKTNDFLQTESDEIEETIMASDNDNASGNESLGSEIPKDNKTNVLKKEPVKKAPSKKK